MSDAPSPSRNRSLAWPLAVTLIAIVAIVAGTLIYLVSSLARIPDAAVEHSKEVIASIQDLARAFREGTVETRFMAYANRVSGNNYLQVATLDRVEVFTREDRASIFWGAVPLPDVVVSATAPVQYTAYVDLEEDWHLRLENRVLHVEAPTIRFNQPAIDASQLTWTIEEGSLLRDESAAIEDLKRGLTSMSRQRTHELRGLVRETARSQIEAFVRTWLLQSFPGAGKIDIEVLFSDELRPSVPVLEISPREGTARSSDLSRSPTRQ